MHCPITAKIHNHSASKQNGKWFICAFHSQKKKYFKCKRAKPSPSLTLIIERHPQCHTSPRMQLQFGFVMSSASKFSYTKIQSSFFTPSLNNPCPGEKYTQRGYSRHFPSSTLLACRRPPISHDMPTALISVYCCVVVGSNLYSHVLTCFFGNQR